MMMSAMTTANPKLQRFLQSVPIFSGLEGRSMRSVIGVLRRVSFSPGQVICAEGELGRTLYVVEQGEVEVLRTNREGHAVPIVRLGRGECFGEMALVELEARSATVLSRSRCVTWSLNNFDLYRLFRTDNFAFVILLQNVCRLLSRRLRKADSRIAEFLSEPSHKMLARPKPGRRPVKARARTRA
jgi:CRP-like cAMP-binding protein